MRIRAGSRFRHRFHDGPGRGGARRTLGPCLPAALAAAILVTSAATADVARYEIHPFLSTTISDHEFLSGNADGTPTMLAGALRIPRGDNDRLPAMVVVHGSSGVGGTDGISDHAAARLNELGLAAFIMDSFSARGLTSTIADQTLLGRLQMIYDAYRALELLAEHPRVDPERIGVIGFSRGAEASVFAAMDRFGEMHGPQNGLEFAAYVGFYTPCGREYIDRTSVADKPILLLHGEEDDWTPIEACRTYVEELQEAGADARLLSYPDAGHAFEAPAIPSVFIERAQNPRNCRLGENAANEVVNLDTGEVFDWNEDPCVERGASVGYVEAASQQAYTDLAEFLREALKLR